MRSGTARHAVLVAVLAVLVCACPAAARPQAGTICPDAYEADYVAGAVHLTVTRTGHFVAPRTGVTVDATQTDVVAPARDARDRVKLQVETVCKVGEIRFLDEVRRGSSQVTGTWAQTADPSLPAQGTCAAQHTWPLNRDEPAFRLFVKRPGRGGYNAFFKPGARRVAVQMTVSPPDGLTCDAPLDAHFPYPSDVGNRLASPPATLPVSSLQRDRPFTVRLAGSAGPHHRDWPQAPLSDDDAAVTYAVTWSGSISFRPAGCRHYEFTTHSVRVKHDCR